MTTLFMKALRCEETPRRPLWIMRQAGRFLPEYRALKEKYTFEQLCADPDLAVEVTMMPLRRFPLDAAITFADLMTPAAAIGVDFRFDPGPIIGKPVRTAADVEALVIPEGEAIAPEVQETQRRLRKELKPEQALLGFGGAPLSLAAYLVQGRGGKDKFPALRAMLISDPKLFSDLLAKLSRLVARYLIAQHRAGCDAVQVFDSWAGILSRADWHAHVRPHLVDLLEEVGRAGVPRILFAHGAPHLIDDYAELPSEALACCWLTDLPALREKVGYGKALQGNLDPAALHGGPETTRKAAEAFLARMPRRGHVMNLGHGILPDTPVESVQALLEVVHAEGKESA